MTTIIVLSIVVVLIGAFFFAICPNLDKTRKAKMKPFEEVYIAHRGFFDNTKGVPENSLPAFRKAVEAGYGIELDVQRSKDGQLFVFHDDSMERMCGIKKNLRDMTTEEIRQCRLLDTEEKVPFFSDVLAVINGKVPLIVEIKYEGDFIATTEATAVVMDSYQGIWCMESFEPRSVQWYKKHRPDIIRGQLSTDYRKDNWEKPRVEQFCLTNLMYNMLSRPDFIAYNHKYHDNLSLNLCRSLFGAEMVAWTIKNQKELELAKQHHFEILIFDSFDPR